MKLSELHYVELLYETRQSIAAKDVNLVYYLQEIERRLSTGEAAVKKVAELEKEIKEWENSRDGFLLSSQAKNFKIMELEKEAKRKADLFAKKCFECAALKQQDEAGQRALKAMEKFSSEYKQWVSDYPKVVQKSKFFDDLIEMLQHKEAL